MKDVYTENYKTAEIKAYLNDGEMNYVNRLKDNNVQLSVLSRFVDLN